MARTYDETRDEGERATLQRRIALCAKVAFWLDLTADVVFMTSGSANKNTRGLRRPAAGWALMMLLVAST